jgi:hypothetical protein
MARTSSRKRQQWATIRDALDSLEASIISSHSSTLIAIGFSTITCFPLRSSATVCGAWSAFGVATTAASTSWADTISWKSVVTLGMP